MPDPTPVPLTDIEVLAANPGVVGYVPVKDVGVLCEALRIAVEGLEHITKSCSHRIAGLGCDCDRRAAHSVLAAVRELVNLGESQ